MRDDKTYRKIMFICSDSFQSQTQGRLREWRESDNRFQKISNGSRSWTIMLYGTSKNDAWPNQDGGTYKDKTCKFVYFSFH